MKIGRAIRRQAIKIPFIGPIVRQAHQAMWERKMRRTNDQANIERSLAELHALYREVNDKLDLLKSAAEIPHEWFEEYRLWKRDNPIPANPLVSVCVATYNRSKLLTSRCLRSLLDQSWKNMEVVVVGDCCTDDTAPRVQALNDPRIHFVNLSERGHYPSEPVRRWQVAGSSAVNYALSLCSGDFVTHLDDDDEHSPDRVEKLVAFATENDLDFVWHPFHLEHQSGNWEERLCDDFRLGHVTTSSIFYRRWLSRIGWDVHAHLLNEPGDWNRFRKFKYLGLKGGRYPESLLRHYAEGSQRAA